MNSTALRTESFNMGLKREDNFENTQTEACQEEDNQIVVNENDLG